MLKRLFALTAIGLFAGAVTFPAESVAQTKDVKKYRLNPKTIQPRTLPNVLEKPNTLQKLYVPHKPATAGKKPTAGNEAQPVTSTSQPTTGTSFSMLAMINAKRDRHCVPALAWSAKIAATAQQWAEGCVFQHDPLLHSHGYGETLFWGASSAQTAVDSWYGQIRDYDYSASAFSARTGLFTQLVWKNTTQIGCGSARCKHPQLGDVYFYVCRYSPPGNYAGQFQQNVLPVCK